MTLKKTFQTIVLRYINNKNDNNKQLIKKI